MMDAREVAGKLTKAQALVQAHANLSRRCANCVEHGAPYDGPCDACGYADPRWCPEWLWGAFNEHHRRSALLEKDTHDGR